MHQILKDYIKQEYVFPKYIFQPTKPELMGWHNWNIA